ASRAGITLFEEKNFQGRSFECSSDRSDLQSHLSRCNSVKVDSGCFMLYEHSNFMGQQLFLKRGEYPDIQCQGLRTLSLLEVHRGTYRIKVYEKDNLRSQMMELTEDCPQVLEQLRLCEIQSCVVLEGHWIFYEMPNYRGRQYLLRPGEYRRFSDWGATTSKVGSLRRAADCF
uniref:Beta/gamma crystallin 'Greek key' domain-containing protein n=1 Tax=Crocodylus porosus TaxID=8502 RepID=A0A7M4E0Y6_CROPO